MDRLHRLLDALFALMSKRGNLDNIKMMIDTYNTTNPTEEPFDLDSRHGQRDGLSMLAAACVAGQIEYVRWLLEHGCDPWIITDHGETVFHMAISGSDMIDEIDYAGHDKRPPNSAMGVIMTLLHHIEDEERQTGVDFYNRIWELRNDWQKSPLDYSARKGGAEVLKLFIARGAKINGPLFSTQFETLPNSDRRTNIRRRNPDPYSMGHLYTRFGTSLLHQAIEYRNTDAFDILMEDGAYTHVYNAQGDTPLMCAIRHSNFDVLERLITSPGIDLSQVHGHTFEFIPEVGEQYQIDRHRPQEQFENWTVLHLLAEIHNDDERDEIVDVIRMLVRAGADVRLKTAEGWTPRDIAIRNGNDTMENVFEELEETSPWSPNYKRLRREALYLALHPVRGADAPVQTLPRDLFSQYLDLIEAQNNPDQIN
jgi:ankyrin repeat protein